MTALEWGHNIPATSCPAVKVTVVRQFDERFWEKFCVKTRTPDVNDCDNVVLILSSCCTVVEYGIAP